MIFPEAKTFDSWASKGVLGERLWTKNIKWDWNLGLNILSGLFFIPALFFTFVNDFWLALLCTLLSFIFKMWFVNRMVLLDEHVSAQSEAADD